MKLLRAYLRDRRRVLAAAALCALLFAAVFGLYRLPVEAVAYAAGLCLSVLGVFAAADFRRFAQKRRRLAALREEGKALLAELPMPDGTVEEDYQRLVFLLRARYRRLRTESDARYSDMIDYYTVWAHQIKTPIASMSLRLQTEDSALSRELSAGLFHIEQYVGMVLAFLRLDSESGDYVFAPCELDELLRRTVKKFAGEFIGRKLSLHYEPVSLRVVTDEKWLGFVLEQLLSNALKYTREGGIRIYPAPEQTLCIEDTGIGIAAEDVPRVFERGYTGYNGRIDRRASGLGLYLCKTVCDRLGHTISLTSAPGRGTTVRLCLAQRQTPHE